MLRLTALLCCALLAAALRAAESPAPPPKTIAMIGDSITHGGKWDELLARPEVLSWGIPGYTTGQLAWTFKDIVRKHPLVKIVFLNGGINDLSLGVPTDRVYENQVKAIAWWREQQVTPVIESTILQVDRPEINAQITALNARLRAYCETNKVQFLDLNAVLASEGHLRPELSSDGTHLRPEAYPLWARVVADCLTRLVPGSPGQGPS
jgi:lysophospholipase L1-like esterase